MKTLIIDNYDSFTFNLYQIIGSITGSRPKVVYNDKFDWQDFLFWNVDKVVISPGPGRPENKKDFGMSSEIIVRAKMPVLGVCLGHQGIGNLYGAKIVSAKEILHGRKSKIFHTEKGIFRAIPQGFEAVRYHSFAVDEKSLPESIEVTAWTKNKTIMGIKHKTRPLFGVQFHPESIGTKFGGKILENFLKIK